jgi:hypothetical protein
MKIRSLIAAFVVLGGICSPMAAFADDDDHEGKRKWWRGEWREDHWNRPCEVKLESKRGEFKRRSNARMASVPIGMASGKRSSGMARAR